VGRLTRTDIAVIVAMSGAIPLAMNLVMGATIAAARARLATPAGMRRMTRVSGFLLIAVGLFIGAANLWS
jgi:threonine/homoserine/homoserine lactone efflux protein